MARPDLSIGGGREPGGPQTRVGRGRGAGGGQLQKGQRCGGSPWVVKTDQETREGVARRREHLQVSNLLVAVDLLL